MKNQLATPQFRIFFAIQQAVLLQKNLDTRLQIYVRTSLPETLKLSGSFSAFVLLLSSFLQLSARSYDQKQQKLVFVTTDLINQNIILKITAGGSLLQAKTNLALNENLVIADETKQQLSESIQAVQRSFRGNFELISFPDRGSQIIVTLPTQTDSQNHDRS